MMTPYNRRQVLKSTGVIGTGMMGGLVGNASAAQESVGTPMGRVYLTEVSLHYDIKSNREKNDIVMGQADAGSPVVVSDDSADFIVSTEENKQLLQNKEGLVLHQGLSAMGESIQFKSSQIPLDGPDSTQNRVATAKEPTEISGTIIRRNGKAVSEFSHEKKIINVGKTKQIKLNQLKQKVKSQSENGKWNVRITPIITVKNHGVVDATMYEVNP